MKIILTIFAVIIVLFLITQIFAWKSQSGIETYPYTVARIYENFEIRNYEARLFTTVKLPTSEYDKGSSQGFSILAGYIFGNNAKNEKIAMTSPVAMSMDDRMTMMFMVPKEYNKETLPQPAQSAIKFVQEPARTVAAITFGGWSNDAKIQTYKNKLISELDDKGIAYTNRFFVLGYNAPYEVFNRKNEIIVELGK